MSFSEEKRTHNPPPWLYLPEQSNAYVSSSPRKQWNPVDPQDFVTRVEPFGWRSYVIAQPTSTADPAIHLVPEGAYGSTLEPRSPMVAFILDDVTVVKTASPAPPAWTLVPPAMPLRRPAHHVRRGQMRRRQLLWPKGK